MIKEKYKKVLIVNLCIILVIMSIFSSVMSGHALHKDNCNVANCKICAFINIANNLIKNIIFIFLNIFALNNIIPTIKLINETGKKIKKLTLVELKVIQIK